MFSSSFSPVAGSANKSFCWSTGESRGEKWWFVLICDILFMCRINKQMHKKVLKCLCTTGFLWIRVSVSTHTHTHTICSSALFYQHFLHVFHQRSAKQTGDFSQRPTIKDKKIKLIIGNSCTPTCFAIIVLIWVFNIDVNIDGVLKRAGGLWGQISENKTFFLILFFLLGKALQPTGPGIIEFSCQFSSQYIFHFYSTLQRSKTSYELINMWDHPVVKGQDG